MRSALALLSLISAVGGLTLYPKEALSRVDDSQGWAEKEEGHANWCRVKTDPPTRCLAGSDHWSYDEMRAAIPEFAKFHQARPIHLNSGGGGVNHAFALWFTIKRLQPKYIIESGVYHGGSTWLMRTAAGNDTKIFSIDPHPTDFLKWQDDNPNTQYFLGDKFMDFNQISWDNFIPKKDRANTLVFLDDHQSSIRRVKEMLGHQFVHLWYDDNYKFAFPWMGLTYSFNLMCSDVTEKTKNKHGMINYMDSFGKDAQEISLEQHEANLKFLLDHTDVYFEFPAVWDRCQSEGRTSLLNIGEGSSIGKHGQYNDYSQDSPVTKDLKLIGLPGVRSDPYTYATHYPPYVKLVL